MANIKITRKNATVFATYLPYPAYKALVQMGQDHNAEIGQNDDGTLRLTFDEVKTAKNVVAQWTAEYNANRKVSVEPTKAPTVKPKASKGKTVTSTTSPTEKFGKLHDALNDFVVEARKLGIDNKVVSRLEGAYVDLGYAYANTFAKGKASSTKKATDKKTSAPKKTSSSSKKAPRKTKGNGVTFDFGKIKGKTNSDKNRALHATLVKMGLKDSRSAEYLAIWNARPWAN